MALRVFLVALAAVWAAIVFLWPIGFWYAGDEYAYLALAHAINFEATIKAGMRFADSGLGNHPGVPLYFLSWVCLRVSGIGQPDLIAWSLANPEPFYLTTRIAAGLIAAGAAIVSYSALAPLPPWKRVLAISTFFAADPWSLLYGLTSISNETFAFPIVALLFWLVKRAQDRAGFWIAAGAIAATAYLIKLPYLSVAAGVAALAIFMPGTLPSIARRALISGAAFILAVSIVHVTVAGWVEFQNLLTTHLQYFTKAPSGFGNPFIYISWPLLLSVSAASIASLAVRDRVWTAVALCAFGAGAIALGGNFSGRYMPALTAFLPFLWRYPLQNRYLTIACLLVTVASFPISLQMVASEQSSTLRDANAMKADERVIAKLPLNAGDATLWTYAIKNEKFSREFVLQLAGLQQYAREKLPPSADFSSYQLVDRRYRYIILERSRHPKATSFHEPNGLPIKLESAASVTPLEKTVIVELSHP